MTKNKEQSVTDGGGLSFTSSFHLEAERCRSGMTVTIGGLIGISDFSEERIVLASHSGRIIVNGRRLRINVYEGGSAEVIGRIEEISFKYGKN